MQHKKKLKPFTTSTPNNIIQIYQQIETTPIFKKKFQELSAAYDVLGDEKKRKKYDTFGDTPLGTGELSEEEVFGKMSQAMEEMMGKNEDFHRGANIELPMELTFEEAALGTEKLVDYQVRVECSQCNGLATLPGHYPEMCFSCNGKGFTTSGKGMFMQKRVCTGCSGTGAKISHPCKVCKGRGTVPKARKLKVQIPSGVDTDHQVRLADKGNIGDRRSGKTGSLYLNVTVKKHHLFRRENFDVHSDVPITVSQAILGDTIKVQTLGGFVELKLPSGTQPGEKRVLKRKGILQDESKSLGDHYVHFKVIVPKSITKEQFELITLFSKNEKISPEQLSQPKWKTILYNIKSYFWKP